MCTLTWFREARGYELFFNRDERLTRKPARPPELRTEETTRFIAPRDGEFGGLWIGVNEGGLALCLLNGRAEDDAPEPDGGYTSRGMLLPRLIARPSLARVADELPRLGLDRFRSFLIAGLAPRGDTSLWEWRSGRLRDRGELDPNLPLVSSSFDTEDVRNSRIELFRSMARDWSGPRLGLHLRYHRSHRPARGPHSPCMHRRDAETVSFTRVQVTDDRLCLHYLPHSPCTPRPADDPLCMERAGTGYET